MQRFDVFTPDLLSLLNDLTKGNLKQISFRNELVGGFVISRAMQGALKGEFAPTNPQAVEELKTRLTEWRHKIA